jgi:hypothetical protein
MESVFTYFISHLLIAILFTFKLGIIITVFIKTVSNLIIVIVIVIKDIY